MSNVITTMVARKDVFIPAVIGAVVLLTLPLFAGAYYEHIFILVFLNVSLAVGYRVAFVTGLGSLCHISFYALGAYTSALMTIRLGVPWGVGFIAGGIIAAGVAALFGWPAVRARGPYFFILSFALFMVIDMVIGNWTSLTGGRGGLEGIPGIAGFASVTPYYYIAAAFAAGTCFVLWRLDRSRFGRELIAIGEADNLAEAYGINTDRHRVIAFTIGAFLAGLSGSIFGHYLGFISPKSFGMFNSLYILIWVIIGGERKFWGPIAGATIMTLIAEGARMSGQMRAIVYSVVLLAVILTMPRGLADLADTWRTKRAGVIRSGGANGNP